MDNWPKMMRGDLKGAIKRCYPRGSKQSTEKSPRPNELSTLLFYLDSRHGKIPRAAKILVEKTDKYAARGSDGNLTVTLRIVKELVLKEHDHLDLFAPSVLHVVNRTLEFAEGSDPLLHDEAAEIFQTFNQYHTGVLFAGNVDYSTQFSNLVRKFNQLAGEDHPRLVRLAAIDTLRSLTDSPVLATRVGQRNLESCIPTFYSCLQGTSTNIFTQFKTEVTEHERRIREGGPQRVKTSASSLQFGTAGKRDAPESLIFKALDGLRTSLNVNSSEQLARVFSALLKAILADRTRSPEWRRALVVASARWSELQLRFAVVNTLVGELGRLKVTDLQDQLVLSDLLTALLQSDVSKVGLSVVDTLRQLIDLQHRLVPHDVPDVPKVVDSLRTNVGALAQLRIYPGQVSDMIGEILARYATEAGSLRKQPSIVSNDLRDIHEILLQLPDQYHLSIGLWASTHWMLTSADKDLLVFFTLTFTQFMSRALKPAQPTARQGFNLARQLIQTLVAPGLRVSNYIAVYYCMVALVDHLGTMYASSALPWILQVQSQASNMEDWRNVATVSVCQALLLAVSRTSDRHRAAERVFHAIDMRVQAGRWLPGILYPPSVPITDAVSTADDATPPTFSSASGEIHDIVDPSDLDLTSEEFEWAQNPSALNDEPTVTEDLFVLKGRTASPTSDSEGGGSKRFVSNRSTTNSIESSAPRVADLLNRRPSLVSMQSGATSRGTLTSPQSAREARNDHRPAKNGTSNERNRTGHTNGQGATSILDMVQQIRLDGTSRGRLTTV